MKIEKFHVCDDSSMVNLDTPEGFNGNSVEIIFKAEGKWVATQVDYEYGTVVKFCPFCGNRLED